jgi:hypothetical protein
VVAASGPAALWARIHDAVTVRLALARSGEAVEDSAHIVSGAPLRRGAQLPSSPPATREVPDEVELSGVAGTPRAPSPPAAQAPGAAEPADWNAFAGSSYPDVPVEPEREPRPRPLGRHSRAVAREQVPLSTRLGRALTAAAAAVRAGATTASAQVRAGVGRMSRGGPDNRLLAGIAGIGLIFVVALLIGRSPSRPATPATRAAPASTAPQAHQSGPPQPSAAASTAGAATPPQVQTFGAGDTGFQVIRLRYGAQKTSLRVVFDMGAAGTAAAGTPKVTLAFSTPTTLLVTIDGTLPAGSTGTPPPGKVISSVTLVSTTGHKTVYRFALTRAATATAFYLTAPTRFVLDIH